VTEGRGGMRDRMTPWASLSAMAVAVASMTLIAVPTGAGAATKTGKVHQLTPRPPLGWNSFDSYACHLDEEDALANLEAMASSLKPAGYEYFVIDMGWYHEYDLIPGTKNPVPKEGVNPCDNVRAQRLDEYGRYLPSNTYFPRGLTPVIERTHQLGLKFGIHIMRGIPREAVERNLPILGSKSRASDIADTSDRCSWSADNFGVDMSRPGAQAHYDSVIALLAEWGVDFIKADDITEHPAEIEAVVAAIARARRPIVLSLSPGGKSDLRHLRTYRMANMVRTTADVWDNRASLSRAFDAWYRWRGVGGEGFWPDLDMIPFGRLRVRFPGPPVPPGTALTKGEGPERDCALTLDQQRTFITMRALAASPLFMGGDLPTLDAQSLSLIRNEEVLACNQNGVVGRRVYSADQLEVWLAPSRQDRRRGWLGLFNRKETSRTVRLSAKDIPWLGARRLYDVWAGRSLPVEKERQFEIGADGAVFLRFE